MKWVTVNYLGDRKVWYSEEVIKEIERVLNEYCKQKIHDPDIEKLLKYIRRVDNDNSRR